MRTMGITTIGVLAATLAAGAADAQLTYTTEQASACAPEFHAIDEARALLARLRGGGDPNVETRARAALATCLERYDGIRAELAAREVEAAREARIAEGVKAASQDPAVVVLALSVRVCRARDARRAAVEGIATERRYGREAGVLNLTRLGALRDELRAADEGGAAARRELARRHARALPCDSAEVAEVYACAADPGADECADEATAVRARVAVGP